MTTLIKYSTDGGATWGHTKEGVRIQIEVIPEIHINVTQEGVIIDTWEADEHIGTSCQTFEEIVDSIYK